VLYQWFAGICSTYLHNDEISSLLHAFEFEVAFQSKLAEVECKKLSASEQTIQQHIRIACSTGATRLFRNNTGTLRDQHGRPVQFGLCKGSADLIGYRTITITPDMVGQQVAVFASIEVKTPTGRIRPEQQAWLETIQAAGGIAGVARSVEDALRIVTAHG
jgi:hypothetical protein